MLFIRPAFDDAARTDRRVATTALFYGLTDVVLRALGGGNAGHLIGWSNSAIINPVVGQLPMDGAAC